MKYEHVLNTSESIDVIDNENKYKVYVYKNKINNKMYVGQTCRTLRERAGKDGVLYLQCPAFGHAIKKYGWDTFEPHIVFDHLSREKADYLEKELIKILKTQDSNYGYNISAGGSDNTYTALDISGKKFNRWTAIKLAETPKGHVGRYWLCQCDCGSQKIVRQCNLISGTTKSCGCLSAEISSKIKSNDYEMTGQYVTVFMNDNYQFIIDNETYFTKLSNQHCYYDSLNKRIMCSHDVNIYHVLFPFLNRRNSYKYITHLNHNKFDFRKSNLKITFPDNFNYDDFLCYVSENIMGISYSKRESIWIVNKGVVDSKRHSFKRYIDAKECIFQNNQEVLVDGN